jgi:hypothetical protein
MSASSSAVHFRVTVFWPLPMLPLPVLPLFK